MIHTLINKAFAGHDVQMVFASNGAEGLEVAEREGVAVREAGLALLAGRHGEELGR